MKFINNIYNALEAYIESRFKTDFLKTHPDACDIPNYCYYDEKTKRLTDKRTKDVFSIYYSLSPELCDRLNKNFGSGWPKCACLQTECMGGDYHTLRYVPTQIEVITLKGLIDFIEQRTEHINEPAKKRMLRKLNPDCIVEELNKIWRVFNLRETTSYQVYGLNNTERELLHCLFMLRYDKDDVNKVIEYSRQDHREDFPEDLLEKGVFCNNRLFLPSDDEGQFTVLSKNPYDYIWCSTGNGYQSCFSLESGYWGIQALPLLATQSWHFMAYTTSGMLEEFGLFGHKFPVPNIKCRCWVYRTENGYMMDKMYGKSGWDSSNMEDTMFLLGFNKDSNGYKRSNLDEEGWNEYDVDYIKIDKKDGDCELNEVYRKYNTYCDSINPNTEGYLYDVGIHEFTRRGYRHNSVSPKESVDCLAFNRGLEWNPSRQLSACNGTIGYFKTCPKTKMPIDDTETEHWAAKYLDKPVKSLIIVTVDNTPSMINTLRYLVSDESVLPLSESENEGWFGEKYGNFSDKKVNNLDRFKELLRNTQEENPQYDCILLRIIDKNRVTFQPFYAKKESRL